MLAIVPQDNINSNYYWYWKVFALIALSPKKASQAVKAIDILVKWYS